MVYIFRLEAYDRNSNFGSSENVEREYEMKVPCYEQYKDINKDTQFTPVKKEAIAAYLGKMGKSVDDHVKYIYESKFLKYVRLACDVGLFFVRAECHAEMKKSISYKVDVCVDVDGCIVQCQCECAAGMGPSAVCKHVSTVLFGLQMFSECGDIVTEETCTQNLQTFHHTKRYKGSPIKAKDFPLANQDLNVIFEPRPREFQNAAGHQDIFRNVWLNHPNLDYFPVSQLFSYANKVALNNDHDYLQGSLSDNWLRNMNITAITDNEIMRTERQTCGQSNNKLWHTERQKRIHSSNFGKICKATEKTDLNKVAKNLTKHSPQLFAPAILHGKCYESVALQEFQEKSGIQTKKCGIFVPKSHPYLAASPDAVIDDNRLVEIKCPYSAKNKEISEETVPYLNYVNDTLELGNSHDYYYQVQGQLFCSGRKECTFIVYTLKDIKTVTIHRDEHFIENMLKKLKEFFETHFKKAVLNRFFFQQMD